ncbi:hypothetical protein Fmac_018456 [Flemingia macrophylla]|uniref:F-box domain-containing protein n=1 Tax=Flemingia macrophylla TaxID=520843 RepID=A0ABD1M705_9FABA
MTSSPTSSRAIKTSRLDPFVPAQLKHFVSGLTRLDPLVFFSTIFQSDPTYWLGGLNSPPAASRLAALPPCLAALPPRLAVAPRRHALPPRPVSPCRARLAAAPRRRALLACPPTHPALPRCHLPHPPTAVSSCQRIFDQRRMSLVAIVVTTLCFLFAVFSLFRSYSLPRRFTPPRKYHCDCASNSDSTLNGGMLEPSPVPTLAPLAERRTGSSMMEKLVPEITTHALSYLDYPSLCPLSMTNSSMRKASNDDNAWKALYHKVNFEYSVTPTNGWKAYYAATRAIVNINTEFFNIVRDKSLPAMSHFWLNADYVKCIHASGELFSW